MVNLITEHIDIWTAAQTPKFNGGRGRGKNSNGQSLHGIKKLRELILELAVRGKLVPQDPNDLPAPRPGTWFVYALECEDGSIYIGQTQDILKRWKQHAIGRGADWTRKNPPVRLVHWEESNSLESAVEREKELKTGFGRKWLKRELAAGRTRQAGEPASVLFRKIAKERALLIKEGKIKSQKKLPENSDDEKPFDLPVGWEWARLSDVSAYKPGKTPSTKNPVYWSDDVADIPWVSISDMEHFGLVTDTTKKITQAAIDQVFKYDVIPAGSLLMSFKLTIGKISILDIDAYHNEAIISIQPFTGISRDFLFKFLPNRALVGNTKSAIMGKTLNATSLALLLIPIPPLSEQHRIVAKIDELMALCDQLEHQQTDNNAAHQTLVDTLLVTLTTAADQGEFAEAWQRIANHFGTLFTTEHSIDQLKQTILQLAVMGKLVPQDPNDEPASMLLGKIAKEKAHLIKEGKIKKQKPLPRIGLDKKPFELPEGWEWTQLGNLSANIHYGYTASADHGISGIRLLRITDIQNDSVNWETVPGCEIEENKANDYLLENDDILIARTGGTIGKSYLVEHIDVKAVFASYLIRVKRIEGMYSPFIKTYLGSQLYWQQLYENSMGTGQPNVNATALKGLLFPMPPLSEQRRIVSKINEMMALCDNLKAQLNDVQTIQVQFADAIVEQAMA